MILPLAAHSVLVTLIALDVCIHVYACFYTYTCALASMYMSGVYV